MPLRVLSDTASPIILPRKVFYTDMSCLMAHDELSVWKPLWLLRAQKHICLLCVVGYVMGQNLTFLRLAAI